MRERGVRLTRRALLAEASVAGALASMGCRADTPKAENPGHDVPRSAGPPPTERFGREHDGATSEVLDVALERLASRGPVYGGALANHAPMVAEVLVALGRGDAVSAFLDRYTPRLEAWPRSAGRVTSAGWASALGKSERVTDWREFFTAELASAPCDEVLSRWLPRLASGVSGSAAHGVIRVSHIVRALTSGRTEPRLAELAAALAYWAASFHSLPDAPHASSGLSVEQAIDRLEMVPGDRRVQGSIVARLAPLGGMASFAGVADLVDLSGDSSVALSAVTRAFARVYCANAAERDGRIARIHTVTGASALRPLLPHVPVGLHRPLLRHIWQLDAAVYVTHARRDATPPAIESFATPADLVAAAIESGDEHAIKLTEVALREDAVLPDPAFARAAAHWVRVSLAA